MLIFSIVVDTMEEETNITGKRQGVKNVKF